MRPLSLTRKLLTLLPLFFLLGSGLLLFFLILSGASSSSSLLRKFYWLKVDTPDLGDYSVTEWTNYRLCSATEARCSGAQAGLPISPKDNFGSNSSIPEDFLNNRNSYYYESRIGWLFLLIACVFVILAILLSLPLLCVNSSVIISIVTLFTIVGFVFIAVSALLYTHVLTKAKRHFDNNGQNATIGTKMMAFIWTTTLLLLLSSFMTFLLGCCQFAFNRYDQRDKEVGNNGVSYSSDDDTYNDSYLAKKSTERDVNYITNKKSKKTKWNKRKNSAQQPITTTAGPTLAPTTRPMETGVVTPATVIAGPIPVEGGEAQSARKPSSNKINFFRVRNKKGDELNKNQAMSDRTTDDDDDDDDRNNYTGVL